MTASVDLSNIITSENGKTLTEANAEVVYAAGFVDWFASAAPRVEGSVSQVVRMTIDQRH